MGHHEHARDPAQEHTYVEKWRLAQVAKGQT
jgi:hypothetical protein